MISDEEKKRELAEQVRGALIEAAASGWEDAAMAGLCGEGAWEAAVGRMRSLDLGPLIHSGGPATFTSD